MYNLKDILDVQPQTVKKAIEDINLAIEQGDLEKAKQIGKQDAFKNNCVIQFKIIQLLEQEENYEEILEIGNKKLFENNPLIQEEILKIAIEREDYETAKKIGEKGAFKNNAFMQEQIKNFKLKHKEKNIANEKQKFLNEIKTKLYYDKISQEDMKNIKDNTSLSEYERTCILLAIYDKKRDEKNAREIAKIYKAQNKDVAQNKIINMILQRVENKKIVIYDIGFYDRILGWEFDEHLQSIYNKEQKEQQENRKQLQNVKVTIQTKLNSTEKNFFAKPVMQTYSEYNYETREKEFRNRIRVTKNKTENIEQERKIREKNYYTEIMDYLNSKRKEIYVSMQSSDYKVQKDAISKWDKMETLIEKVSTNRDDKDYIDGLHNKISQLREKESGISR